MSPGVEQKKMARARGHYRLLKLEMPQGVKYRCQCAIPLLVRDKVDGQTFNNYSS